MSGTAVALLGPTSARAARAQLITREVGRTFVHLHATNALEWTRTTTGRKAHKALNFGHPRHIRSPAFRIVALSGLRTLRTPADVPTFAKDLPRAAPRAAFPAGGPIGQRVLPGARGRAGVDVAGAFGRWPGVQFARASASQASRSSATNRNGPSCSPTDGSLIDGMRPDLAAS